VVAEPLIPDPQHVAEQPHRHEQVDSAHVLDEQVDKCLVAGDVGREEQIGLPLRELVLCKMAVVELHGGPVDVHPVRLCQRDAQLAYCILRASKEVQDQRIVRVANGRGRPSHP
jgi:hypothetical protein